MVSSHHHSRVIDPLVYSSTAEGLTGGIPVRVHQNAELADRGALRARRDWERAVGPLPRYAGIMGPEYNFIATCMPDVLSDRLELVAYISELGFLIDDVVDAAASPMVAAAPFMTDFFQARAVMKKGPDADAAGCSPMAKILIGFGRAMVATDEKRAREAFQWVKKWGRQFIARPDDSKACRNFDDYLEYRRVNVSPGDVFGLALFGAGLDIPVDQQQMCLELSESFWLQTSLTNDYHSWERERDAAGDDGAITNAIWVLMNRHAMTLEEAKAACRAKAKEYAAEYLHILDQVKTRDDLCIEAKHFLGQLKYGISGNAVWSVRCPRYHPNEELTAAQREMAKEIWAEEETGWGRPQVKVVSRAVAEIPKVEAESPAVEATAVVLDNDIEENAAMKKTAHELGVENIQAPSIYLDSLPAKGIRNTTIDALNMWLRVPLGDTVVIKTVVNLLHGASLLLDDIQDSSVLRRGKPATHIVFGTMLTINSACYRLLDALAEVRKLENELRNLHIGQGYDVTWTSNMHCPTEEEYLAMIDGKTSGLFRLLARLLHAKSNSPTKPDVTTLTHFMTLLGRLFQIRDDYMNLTSADYTKQKGFCDDLDEGKYSLPLLHALGRSSEAKSSVAENAGSLILRNLLAQRHTAGRMTLEQKQLFLEKLKEQGSLEYTRKSLDVLQAEMKRLAGELGLINNEKLNGLFDVLKV
ncbi:isoprenoid synthase domain-containing protein [Staphylotrichum tortipilum]|uniref:Isoprenoid synthase domain-containing protein n=1 Tax=Staphylotrichum tortipilum TaxID=2831512 RepID=A0AAN6MH66_9PEZI|nr:isoprenoid synthase domain-containing protein [Staphylotrichum longicolle]